EIEGDEMRAGAHEGLGRERAVVAAQAPPRAAVDEDLHGGARPVGAKHVERGSLGVAVVVGLGPPEPRAHRGAVDGVAVDHLGRVGGPGTLIVLPVEAGLIVVEIYAGAHCATPKASPDAMVRDWPVDSTGSGVRKPASVS